MSMFGLDRLGLRCRWACLFLGLGLAAIIEMPLVAPLVAGAGWLAGGRFEGLEPMERRRKLERILGPMYAWGRVSRIFTKIFAGVLFVLGCFGVLFAIAFALFMAWDAMRGRFNWQGNEQGDAWGLIVLPLLLLAFGLCALAGRRLWRATPNESGVVTLGGFLPALVTWLSMDQPASKPNGIADK